MKRFFAAELTLRSRIILFFSALLIAVQVVTFLVVNTTSLATSEQQAKKELVSGNRVLQRLLQTYTEQLANASTVLSADFGFRRAAATADSATLRSALENHGNRIGADLVMLFTPDGRVLADTRATSGSNLTSRMRALLDDAEQQGRATGYVVVGKKALVATVLPVLAPDLVAWVVLGFKIDARFVNEVHALTNLHVSLIHAENDEVTLLSSSLNTDDSKKLLETYVTRSDLERSLEVDVSSYGSAITHTTQLTKADGSPIFAVLQRPINDTYYHMNRLRNVLILVAMISIGISIVGIVLIANTITRPLRTLAGVAEKVKSGDFSSAADMAERGEIGLLTEGFNVMRDSIATLLHLAYKDSLTDLPNRAMFVDKMDKTIRLVKSGGSSFSLLFLDLDKFKEINDTYGHDAGDVVLRAVAQKLLNAVRDVDTVARLGGDEFAIILMTHDALAVERVVEQIELAVRGHVIDLGQAKVSVGCSIGVARFPEHGEDHGSLMRHADMAMYRKKHKKSENAA